MISLELDYSDRSKGLSLWYGEAERWKSPGKEIDDKIKLARNSMRIVNKLSEKYPVDIIKIYTIQCASKCHDKNYSIKSLLLLT